jgi:peptidoglycan pentaglycine glycine transferase (the first glycine)
MNNTPSQPPPAVWNAIIAALPEPHLLQTAEWAQTKTFVGWQPNFLVWCEHQGSIQFHLNQWPLGDPVRAAALVLQRSLHVAGLAARMRILYAPKGPLLNWDDIGLRARVIADLQVFARKKGAIFIKIDPDVRLDPGSPVSTEGDALVSGHGLQQLLHSNGWRFSPEQIQFRNTVLIDLTAGETQLLDRMKQKTRYNIRLAGRKGVTIRRGTPDDYPLLYHMYTETSLRDSFTIREEAYYRRVWSTFPPPAEPSPLQPYALPLIAEVAAEPVAALILFIFAQKSWYLYGMSREIHRDKMPNYLLQWEAIRLSQSLGCRVYDLWGAPEVMEQTDPLWGVYRFKEGLGGALTRFLGAWDYPVNSLLYKLYTQTMPHLLEFMRRSGQVKTRHLAG